MTVHELPSPEAAVQWLRSRVTGTLQTDSRRIGPGDGFIAWPGAATDGRSHVSAALAQGAAACLVECDGLAAYPDLAAPAVAAYRGLKAVTGLIAAAWFGYPAASMRVIAFTGTNGKTSSAWWMAQSLSKTELLAQVGAAFVGTLGMGIPPDVVSTGLTTPDPVQLHSGLRKWVDAGVAACAIEASSIGLAEHRLDGLPVQVAVFTNFTQDHLDYHRDMDDYWSAKRALFDWPGLQAAVVNIDDVRGAALAADLQSGTVDVWTTSCRGAARLRAANVQHRMDGLAFEVCEGDYVVQLTSPAIGDYNVANLLGVLAALRALGVGLADASRACSGLQPVPGRMETLAQDGKPLVAIDYAHTPDALGQALDALVPLAAQRGGALWCVFGCGGARDATKRPLMGMAAAQRAQHVVLTSDNPRNEDPRAILDQIARGASLDGQRTRVSIEPDRARAIADAVAQASPEDVVLVAGKGHESTQEIAGQFLPFSDRAHVLAGLEARCVQAAAESRP